MQVSVEQISSIQRKMTVAVPSERIDQEVDTRLKDLVTKIRIDGFRPGKVPMSVIKKRYGQGVYQEVLGEMVESSYRDAIVQEKLRPAGAPEIEALPIEADKGLSFVATFEVYPEFEPVPLEGSILEKTTAEVTDADIDEMIDTLRKQRMEYVAVEREAQNGDRVTVDFVGTQDGEAFDGGSAEDFAIVLGEGRMIKDFEDAILGIKAGEEKTADATFPENYHSKDLAGQTVQFAITAKEVAEAQLPELTEEFIQTFGLEEASLENLKAEVRNNMERELAQALKSQLKTQVMDLLIAKNAVEIPQALITEEVGRLREQMAGSAGTEVDPSRFPDEVFKAEAERRVKLGLVIGETIRNQKFELDKDRVEAELEVLASSYEDPEQVKQFYRTNQQNMASLEAMVMEEQVVDWVVEQAEVTEKASDFKSVMNPNQEAAAS